MGKVGLVLEGGAMRGLYTMGILDVLIENGIAVDGAVGVSAGAVFGCNYKSNQAGRALRYNMNYCRDPRYCSLRSLIKTGDLFGADFCYRELPETLDLFDNEAYEANPMPFYVVCTDVDTGKPIYHECVTARDENLLWMRASASLPLASRIVEIGGQRLMDGGIADPIPLEFSESCGFDRNIVILTRPFGYVKKKNGAMPLIAHRYKKYPEFVRAMAERHLVYNRESAEVRKAEKEGRALVFRPEENLPIGRTSHDPEELKRVYDIGRAQGLKRLQEVKDFIEEAKR